MLARQVGVEHLVVFVNKVDIADEEMLELVEMEVGEMLEAHDFRDVPFIRGSALRALEDGDLVVPRDQLDEMLNGYAGSGR